MTAPKFIAILGGNGSAPGREVKVPGLSAVRLDGAASLWASEHVIPVGTAGAIIGHLFTRSLPSARVDHFSADQVERIVETGGASLLRDFWGGYVAILCGRDGETLVIRDPSGAVPVFWTSDRDRLIVMSEATDAALVSKCAPLVDAQRLSGFLWAPHLVGAQTCLTGVRELLGGDVLTARGADGRSTTIWSPWDQITLDMKRQPADLLAELRETVLDCVRAWGDCFSSIVLGLSGGLDSSIIAAGLRRSSACFRCLTMIGPGADGDERHYAKIITGTYGLEEAHEHYRIDDIDPGRAFLSQLPWPTGTLFAQGIAATHHRLHEARPIDAVFTGNGGDMIFCSMHSVTPLVDLLRARATPAALWRTAADITAITGADIFTISRKAVARALRRNGASLPGGDASFLEPDCLARAQASAEAHPWLCPPDGVPPGRLAHVAMIKRAQIGHEFYPRETGPISVAPLLSQPIMELCLRIPSWEWVRGGVDRAAARRAFAGALPAAILQRQSKGGPGGFMQQIYRHNCEKIRDILADGALHRLGVLDANLRPCDLIVTPGTASVAPLRLMMLAAADAWAQRWSAR